MCHYTQLMIWVLGLNSDSYVCMANTSPAELSPQTSKMVSFFFLTHYSLNLASDNLLAKPVYSFIGLVFIVSAQHVRCLFETGAS